jgi:hypothetical protein
VSNEAEVTREPTPFDDDRHHPVPQPGCNVCVCGLLVDDDSAHLASSPSTSKETNQ